MALFVFCTIIIIYKIKPTLRSVLNNKNMSTVKVYSTPWCMYCKMAKDYFKEKKVEYTEFDVSSDAKARTEMLDKSKQSGVPVIDIDGELIIGFDKERVNKLLGL